MLRSIVCFPTSLSLESFVPSPLLSSFVSTQSLQLVTSEYSKLQSAIDDLGTSINNTLGQQKQDLDRTHKTEMRTLQVEIERLTNERTRLEESIATNERACQLETERDWYKKEALHLDEVLEQTNVRLKELSDRLDESEQDRMWTKGQVEKLAKHKLAFETKLRELGVDTSALLKEEETNVKENGLVDDSVEQASGDKTNESNDEEKDSAVDDSTAENDIAREEK